MGLAQSWYEAGWLVYWLLPIAIGLHNFEEILWLPAWAKSHRQYLLLNVRPTNFRLAAGVLSLIPMALAVSITLTGPGSAAHYLLAAFAVGQSLNVLAPHAIVSLRSNSYMPGLASGALFVLPASVLLLRNGLMAGQLVVTTLALTTAFIIPVMLGSIPVLFRLADGLTASR